MQEVIAPENVQTSAPVSTTIPDQEIYLPGSAEKKRALLMYLLIGIIGSLGTLQQRSVYEKYHLKQAIGRRTVSLSCIVLSLVLLFIPLLKYLPILVYVLLVVMLGVCIKQVKDGKYIRDPQNVLAVFVGLGERICNLFEIKM